MKHARERHGRHRAAVRPRYGRIGLLAAAVLVTLTAVIGASGVLPRSAEESLAATSSAPPENDVATTTVELADSRLRPPDRDRARRTAAPDDAAQDETSLPPGSGKGRRIVFSEGRQRVWLVDADSTVRRTYLASGSIYDNLDPGTYEVYSRSRNAVGIDDSGTMEYFVRFTHGDEGAAIGFHTIPVDDGRPVQTLRQLGTPLSHGCIRQRRADAVALWRFAPIGTTVVVTD